VKALPIALLMLLLATPGSRAQDAGQLHTRRAPTPIDSVPAGQDTAPQAGDVTHAVPAEDALHLSFDGLLQRHVHDGLVDYGGLMHERGVLQGYLASLSRTDIQRFTRQQTLALWINAYNAATLELMLDYQGRIDSIKDISSSKRWDAERWQVAGRTLSLDTIEHKILRPMGDPRIHFAIVCASRSCPDLRAGAYLPSHIDSQLDDAARHFFADPTKGLAFTTSHGFFGGTDYELWLSPILDWFEEDFERAKGDVVSFVLPYAPPAAAAFIRQHRGDLDIEHFDYDWSINDDPARRADAGPGS